MLQRVFTRVSKPAARYSDRGSTAEHCSACRFFMSGGDCARVLGRVLPQGWCKYFSQEAVQRWNPLWQMAGIPAPPGATLDLSFLTSGALDPRITFTRASTATYFNSAGVMQTAAANAPRWDYNPATLALQGLLIEEARTNALAASSDITQSAWVKQGAVSVSGTVLAPDGTVTGQTISVGIAAGPAFYQLATLASGARGEPSFWINPISGSGTVHVENPVNSANGVWTVNVALLAAGWQRITRTHPAVTIVTEFTGTSGNQAGVFIYAAGPTNASWWGFQFEAGVFPTSYIPTTATAVTRAIDQCGISPANMGWFVSPGGSWQAEFISLNPASSNLTRIIAYPLGTGSLTPLCLLTGLQLLQYDGATLLQTANSITVGAVSKAASAYLPGTGTVCLNAGAVASTAMTNGYGVLASTGINLMMAGAAGDLENTTGWLRRVRYWPRALSNSELQQVTT